MTLLEFAKLSAACYGVSYIAAYKDGPWMVIDKIRTAIGAPKCEVCWGPWVASGLVGAWGIEHPITPIGALLLVFALSGTTTWLATKPFSATLQSFGMPGITPVSPSAPNPAATAEDCPSCEKAKRARAAAAAQLGATKAPPEPKTVTTETGRGWSAGLESES